MYERLIRSVKTSMRKSIRKRLISREDLDTMVIEIEGVLNNRPLTYVSSEFQEPKSLTPAHPIGGKQRIPNEATENEGTFEELWSSRQHEAKAW